jgi:glucokinase
VSAGATIGLVADIGGTNARFALADETGATARSRVLACGDYAAVEDAIADYLALEGMAAPPAAALAVASPVTGDQVALTNHPWSFSRAELKAHFRFARLDVVNDFTANALALPRLAAEDRRQVGGGDGAADAPLAILGPGTGLGVSGLVPAPGGGWIPLAGEGGHATLAPATARESAVVERMRQRFDHVSAERAISGPGLVNLYNTLAELDGVRSEAYTPAQIADPQLRASDPLCREAVDMFCAMLGTVAGNVALTLGARGGVFLAGGIVPRLGAVFDTGPFRQRFEEKGRFRHYLAAIPAFVVTHQVPAFVGLAGLLLDTRQRG